jgi:type II secretory pathway pseudopilin PulG
MLPKEQAMTLQPLTRRRGFTPVQLVVLIAILLVVAALGAPLVARIRDAAARTHSENNLKQIGLACHAAHDNYRSFPPLAGEFANKAGSLHFFILPFIEQGALYNSAKDAVWDNGAWGTRIDVYLDPRDATAPSGNVFKEWLATTNYPANYMVFGEGGRTLVQIPDGTSNTLMFAQRYQICNGAPTAWGYPSLYTWAPMFAFSNQSLFQLAPGQADCDPTRPQAIGNIMLIGLCDGSVRSVSPRLSATTWANLCDPADGNVLGNDF